MQKSHRRPTDQASVACCYFNVNERWHWRLLPSTFNKHKLKEIVRYQWSIIVSLIQRQSIWNTGKCYIAKVITLTPFREREREGERTEREREQRECVSGAQNVGLNKQVCDPSRVFRWERSWNSRVDYPLRQEPRSKVTKQHTHFTLYRGTTHIENTPDSFFPSIIIFSDSSCFCLYSRAHTHTHFLWVDWYIYRWMDR